MKTRERRPVVLVGATYVILLALTGVAMLVALFLGTDTAFEESRKVEIPYVATIRGDIEPPYWEFNPLGSLAVLFVVPLVLAVAIGMIALLVRAVRNRGTNAAGLDNK